MKTLNELFSAERPQSIPSPPNEMNCGAVARLKSANLQFFGLQATISGASLFWLGTATCALRTHALSNFSMSAARWSNQTVARWTQTC